MSSVFPVELDNQEQIKMIYVLLPVYNEEANIAPLFQNIQNAMDRHGVEFTIVAYNDGSTDNSLSVLESYKDKLPIEIIGLPQNKGLGVAFKSLLLYVAENSQETDVAVVFDSDNTHNPEQIYQMVERLYDGFDFVIASRYLSDSRIVGLTWFRKLMSLGASLLMRTVFPMKGIRDYTCGYRAYRVSVIRKAIDKYGDSIVTENGFACMAEFLIKLQTLDLLAVEIPLVLRYDFKEGASKMNVKSTVVQTLELMARLRASR